MTTNNSRNPEIADLQARLARFEARELKGAQRRRALFRALKWGAVALGAVAVTHSGVAFSQESCDPEGDLPEALYTFCPGDAANAFHVNWNFRELSNQLSQVATQVTDEVEGDILAINTALDGKLDKNGNERLYVTNTQDAELDNDGAFTIGDPSGPNVTFDRNEIVARNNGAAGTLYINGSSHDGRTEIQDAGGYVVIGAGGDETRLFIRGNVDISGTINCPSDMSRIGDSCIDNEINPDLEYWDDAMRVCLAKERHLCLPHEYAACDLLEPAGSDCTQSTDNTSYMMWTGQMGPGNFDAYQYDGDNDQVLVDGGSRQSDFYCCLHR